MIMKKFLRHFRRDEEGAAMLEYTVLLALITAGVIATITLVGGQVQTIWGKFQTTFGAVT
jgi:pilus assembly protein Flp/PilA